MNHCRVKSVAIGIGRRRRAGHPHGAENQFSECRMECGNRQLVRAEAIRKYGQTTCPLVVTDVRMPDGNGLEVMRSVRASGSIDRSYFADSVRNSFGSSPSDARRSCW